MRLAHATANLALLMACGHVPTAQAAYVDGNELYRHCEAQENSRTYYQDQAYCLGYVVAVADYLNVQRSIETRARCVPYGVPPIQLVDVVRKFLKDNPDKRHWDAPALIVNATVQAFCPSPPVQ